MRSLIFVFFTLILTSFAIADINDGLLAYYNFNNNTKDLTSNKHNGVANNITFVDGINENAAYFNGRSSYIDIGDNLDNLNNDLTLCAWIKSNNLEQFSKIINKGQTGSGTPINSGYSLRFMLPSSAPFVKEPEIWFNICDDTNTFDYISYPVKYLPKNRFIFIAGVLFAKNHKSVMQLFINSVLVASKEINFKYSDTNIPLSIGALHRGRYGSTSEYFKGTIDEVRIYNKALSVDLIHELYYKTINNNYSSICNSPVCGTIFFQGKPINGSSAMLIQSGEFHQNSTISPEGIFKFDHVVNERPFSVIIRKKE